MSNPEATEPESAVAPEEGEDVSNPNEEGEATAAEDANVDDVGADGDVAEGDETDEVGGEGDAVENTIEASPPDFSSLADGAPNGGTPLDRFYEVNVTVWAELGRVTLSLGELLKLGTGSVLKLDRAVSAPVDLMAQGVRVARGEVVVVEDCFAVRIKEIESSRKPIG